MLKRLFILCLLFCCLLPAGAQVRDVPDGYAAGRDYNDPSGQPLYDQDGNPLNPEAGTYRDGAGNRTTWGRDTTRTKNKKKVPVGMFQWVLEPRLGTVIPAENKDTAVHNYQLFHATDGYTADYNYLGNLASPRLSRVYFNRERSDDFLFLQPLSFFRGSLSDFRFTNTKSPITNLTYHTCGNDQTGEDRIRANFATNINKLAGLGFNIDYSYGRGYYFSQPVSMFGSTFYGYYRGEKYSVHAYAGVNHMKQGENGGIEDDRYIEDPFSLQGNYTSENIPTMLSQTWNRNHEQHFYIAQRYNIGFTRELEVPDSLKPKPPSASSLLLELSDSLQTVLSTDSVARKMAVDSLMQVWRDEQVPPTEFVPVTSLIHTLDVSNLLHEYLARNTTDKYYTNHYYGNWNNIQDKTDALSVRNTFGIALREGFNKWAQMGITLFGTHKLRSYRLMGMAGPRMHYTENDLSVGGELSRTQGKVLHYNAATELWLVGSHVGDINVDGQTDLEFRLGKRDSLLLNAHANFLHAKPSFFYRHYHSQSAWWDNEDLSREVRFRIDGTLRLKKMGTWLKVGFENVSNYTYFAMQNTLHNGAEAGSVLPTDYSHAVAVKQAGSVQVFGATLGQDLKWGVLHWDNTLSYQTSTDQDVMPLPTFNAFSNLYLLFRIAKVLRVQMGGDLRFFTSYYAPDYSPAIQQFAVQDVANPRTKIGNYPIIGAYVNMHLKHCRIVVAARHVNAGSGHSFLVPHYPINPMTINIGISWNFIN